MVMSKRGNDLLTAKEIAEICKVAAVTARWWLRDGRLPFDKRIGAMYLVRRSVVQEWKKTWKGKYPVGHPCKEEK